MRHVLCDEDTFAQLIGPGGLYDYELGERYVVTPAPGSRHGRAQLAIGASLRELFAQVSGPTNLGVPVEPGARWYVVPDLVVLPDDAPDLEAHLVALIALEIRSPSVNATVKLAHYREVMARNGLRIEEVWYVDDGTMTVHPQASAEAGQTAFPDALEAVRQRSSTSSACT